ncbi:MAG: HU family DNA-binding protein [Chloroflexota bacterium]|nr:HU family DNA-binding protein [Chloroflexota bacterium]
MTARVEKPELVRLTAERLGRAGRAGRDETAVSEVEEVVDAFMEEVYEALKRGESVSLRNFGSFYVRPEQESWVFRFNPSQRLRALFGWSSTYRGPL